MGRLEGHVFSFSVWNLHVLHVPAWVLVRYSSFFPHSKDMQPLECVTSATLNRMSTIDNGLMNTWIDYVPTYFLNEGSNINRK